MAKLDHVSVVSEQPRTGKDRYKVKAELLEAPTSTWQMRFQSAWLGKPEYRQICRDITFENNAICFAIMDSNQVADSVSAIKKVMADVERQIDFRFPVNRHSRSIG